MTAAMLFGSHLRRLAPGILLMVTGCASDGSNTGTIFSDSAGIRIAVNDPRDPQWSRADVWVLRGPPLVQVGNVPGDPDHALYRVSHARRLRDGRIAVANTGVGDVRIYSNRGELLQTLAIEGGSEASAPVRVEELPGDSLLVATRDGFLLVFDRNGAQAARSALASPAAEPGQSPEVVGSFDDGTLLVRVNRPTDPEASGVGWKQVRLLRYDPRGQPRGSFGDFNAELVLFADRGAYIFRPIAQYAAADSTIWYTSGDHYEAREVGGGGTLRIVRLDRRSSKVLQADIFAYRQAVEREASGTPNEAAIDSTLQASVYADSFPSYDQILVDETGDVWLRNYRWFNIGASAHNWTVLDPTGRYLGEVRIPNTVEVYQIGADFVLGRMSGSQGLEAVYLWSLEKPGAPAASG